MICLVTYSIKNVSDYRTHMLYRIEPLTLTLSFRLLGHYSDIVCLMH